MASQEIYLTSGRSNPELAERVASKLDCNLDPIDTKTFPSGEVYARFTDNVRRKDAVIIQTHADIPTGSTNDMIMEQILTTDAARRAKARSVTAVIPYLGYQRQDRISKRGEPISASVMLQLLGSAGVDHIITVDMHSPGSQGSFTGAFDHITAMPLLREAAKDIMDEDPDDDYVVIAPDGGAAKKAAKYADKLGLGVINMAKSRPKEDSSIIVRSDTYPEVAGKSCLLFDDMIDTAGTLVSAAELLKESGATAVHALATHGVLSDPALDRLDSDAIDTITVTDTIPQSMHEYVLGEKFRVVSVAGILAKTITNIMCGESVSNLFDDENHS